MNRLKLTVILFWILSGLFYAQPRLKITPEKIEFKDNFNRLQNVYLINEGDKPVIIDSIYYKQNLFYMRFNNSYKYHITLYPSDTLKMDCILANYFIVTSADTSDTMYIYSNPKSDNSKVQINIKFHSDPAYGTIGGQVRDSVAPLSNAAIYFFYAGKYLFDSAYTDNKGFYKKILPEGTYLVAAKSQGHYLSYYNDKPDPFQAKSFYLKRDNEETVNFTLHAEAKTYYSIKGKIFDQKSPFGLSKSIAVVRSGTHNPDGGGTINKKSNAQDAGNDIYTTIVNEDGSYSVNNILSPGYYYIQAFSEYYLPGYYNSGNSSSVFWQDADSIYIGSELAGKDIYLERDSSFGAGSVSGRISFRNSSAKNPSDAVVMARSLNSNSFFAYAYASNDGTYSIVDLPYGRYQLLAQKIGFKDALSGIFTIDKQNENNEGINLVFDVTDKAQSLPADVQLFPSFPNPFNPITNIEFFLPGAENVSVDVVNNLGQSVAEIFSGPAANGLHHYVFNGSNLSSGVYFIRLITQKGILARKVMLIK